VPAGEFDADAVRALWRRIVSCKENVVDQRGLLRSMNDRLLGELIMCDPTYVLTIEEREAALSSQSDDADADRARSIQHNRHPTDLPNHGEP
jgi:hypothetical protein